MNPAVYVLASPIALLGGGVGAIAVSAIRNRLGYEHWRMYCPKTARPYPPVTCTCRCKECRSCKRR